MRLLVLLLVLSLSTLVEGQDAYLTSGESDPEAMELLEIIKSDYFRHQGHYIDFTLDIELPGQAKEVQRGQLIQEGEKFVLDVESRKIISDATTVWLYLKEMNEVQINDAEDDETSEFMSPSDIFELHSSGDYVFAISNRSSEDGAPITQIECKPLDDDSEYSKLRLTVLNKGNKVKRLKIFSKDGSRFTMHVSSIKVVDDISDDKFSFDPKDYEGVFVEDLRF